jgi:hypothetical protein
MSDITNNAETMWAVMVAKAWESITVNGVPLKEPADGPTRFIPLFDTRDKAVAWHGSEDDILPVRAESKGQ